MEILIFLKQEDQYLFPQEALQLTTFQSDLSKLIEMCVSSNCYFTYRNYMGGQVLKY